MHAAASNISSPSISRREASSSLYAALSSPAHAKTAEITLLRSISLKYNAFGHPLSLLSVFHDKHRRCPLYLPMQTQLQHIMLSLNSLAP
jgi:hypothetical protein